MVTCRCDVLNHLTGDAAVDYARQHLEHQRGDPQGHSYYRCPETGIGWVEEQAPGAHGENQRRLRRTDRT